MTNKQVWPDNRCVLLIFLKINSSFSKFKKNSLPTDQRTDRRTDRQTKLFRDARTHLKTSICMFTRPTHQLTIQPTNRTVNQPTGKLTDGQLWGVTGKWVETWNSKRYEEKLLRILNFAFFLYMSLSLSLSLSRERERHRQRYRDRQTDWLTDWQTNN